MEGSEVEEEGVRGDDMIGKLLPLISQRLTTAYLKHMAQSLELPNTVTLSSSHQVPKRAPFWVLLVWEWI